MHLLGYLGYLPFLFLLACPLMHLLHGHGGHGRHGADHGSRKTARPANTPAKEASMHNNEPQAYGLWSLVILNSALFIFFAFSFFKPKTRRDWRSLGAFSAFVVALMTEMYGFPLTLYVLAGWLQTRYPEVNWFSHDAGHLLEELVGWRANPHFGPFHILSFIFIGGGFWLIAAAWPILYKAQKEGALATTGPYAAVRHPQYVGFVAVMFGFLLQWPTILTLAMFPVLVVMYWRLSMAEEKEVSAAFGPEYEAYRRRTPAFIPRLGGGGPDAAIGRS